VELFHELHLQARRSMDRVGRANTLQPTALIGEAYLRMRRTGQSGWEDRHHFLMSASRVMRAVLVDHFRANHTVKREKEREWIDLDQITEAYNENGIDLERLDLVLTELERTQPDMARAIQLRFFGGVEMSEIASILGVSLRALEGRWYTVRAWLRGQLS